MNSFKKVIISFMAAVMLFLLPSAVLAGPYNEYLNGDTNFKICDGHMGMAWYVDLSSLNVNMYNPPEYIIGINVLTVDADNNYDVKKTTTYIFKYNYTDQTMYVENTDTGIWRYLPEGGSWAQTGVVQPAGEIAFEAAYGMPFYH